MTPNESTQTIGDYFALLRRRKLYILTILPGTVFLAVCLAYGLPAEYQGAATILIEQPSAGKLVPSTVAATVLNTPTSNITPDQQIELVRRKALSHDQLRELVSRMDPYPDEKDLSAGEKAKMIFDDTTVEKVDPITYKPMPEGAAFSIYYTNPSPLLAQKVTAELAKIFLEFNRKTRAESAAQTYQFLLGQSKQVDAAMREADQKIADFKKRYGAALPEDQARNESSVVRTQAELDDVESRIRLAEQREAQAAVQLSQLSPTMVGAVQDKTNDLATLKAQLADAELRYTPDHPDVKRLRRALQELVAAHSATTTTGARPDNPDETSASTLKTTSATLESARHDLAALRQVASRAQAQLQTLQGQLAIAPSVEKDYSTLLRNREALQSQFQQLQSKLQEAEVGKSYESADQGERFTLVRPPIIPTTAFSPNRLGLILVGFVLGGGFAIGFAVLAEGSDPTVRNYRDVREATAIPMLVAIPNLFNEADRKRRRGMLMAGVAALSVATAIAGFTIWRADRLANSYTVAESTDQPR
jgi:polysaccharide chain length determinant protein (PEP-CTERM system associated)